MVPNPSEPGHAAQVDDQLQEPPQPLQWQEDVHEEEQANSQGQENSEKQEEEPVLPRSYKLTHAAQFDDQLQAPLQPSQRTQAVVAGSCRSHSERGLQALREQKKKGNKKLAASTRDAVRRSVVKNSGRKKTRNDRADNNNVTNTI